MFEIQFIRQIYLFTMNTQHETYILYLDNTPTYTLYILVNM